MLTKNKTSRRLHEISLVKQVWVNFLRDEIIPRNLPFAPYWKDIDSLQASQLQLLVLHALNLDHTITANRMPTPIPMHRTRSVTWVRFIDSQWLVVASSDDVSSSICLWSTTALLESRTCVAPLAEAFLSAPVSNGSVDIQNASVTLALELRGR